MLMCGSYLWKPRVPLTARRSDVSVWRKTPAMWHSSHFSTQGPGSPAGGLLSKTKALQSPPNRKSDPSRRSEAVYCIVNRFNGPVRLLRTKQRGFRIRRNVGCCVAEPLTSLPLLLRDIYQISPQTKIVNSQKPPAAFWLRRPLFFPTTNLQPTTYLSTSLSRLNRVNCLRRHLTIFSRSTGTR